MQRGLLLDVVVLKSAAFLELLAGEDEALLIRRNAFLVLDLGLDVVDAVGGLYFEGDVLARESSNEDLHVFWVKLVLENRKMRGKNCGGKKEVTLYLEMMMKERFMNDDNSKNVTFNENSIQEV